METPRKILDVDSQCFLCSSNPPVKERVKIFGKSSLDIQGLLKAIGIDISPVAYVNACSLYICSRSCYKRLQKVKKLQEELNSIKQIINQTFPGIRSKRLRSDTDEHCKAADVNSSNVVKSIRFQYTSICVLPTTRPPALDQGYIPPTVGLDEDALCSKESTYRPPVLLKLTSTPIRFPRPPESARDNLSCVKISVNYDSKTVNKTLPKEYELLGKALAHGPPQRIAKAIFKSLDLKKLVIEKVLRLLSSEASNLCSRKEPSLLRKTAKSDIVKFSFQSLCEEWQTKAPIFYSCLMSVAGSKNATWLPSVAVAGSVLLKQRNAQMNATATTIGIMLKTGSIEANLTRLSKMKVTTSNQGTLDRMDTLGEDHDIELKQAQSRIVKESCEVQNLKRNVESLDSSENSQAKENLAKVKDKISSFQTKCHPGFSIVFDNIDLEMKRKNMTMAKQNKDEHWVNHKVVINRVSGNQFQWEGPKQEIMDVPNIKFLPSQHDYKQQRHNYIVLVSRILVSYFKCFQPMKEACVQHIRHKYVKEMAEKSEKVPLGVIFKSENDNAEMVDILRQFQTYLPKVSEDTFDPQLVTGDQVSIERAVNVIASVGNGFTSEERLEGFNLQIGDWHAAVKILTWIFKRYYNCKSEGDECTLYSDRTLINRRNVKEDPKTAYRADRDFFLLVINSRIVVAAMKVLGIADKYSNPTELPIPEDIGNASKEQKLQYLHKASAKIIDELVLKESTGVSEICNQIILTQEQEDTLNQQPQTPGGRYSCRIEGCKATFKYDGASRRKHEESHHSCQKPPEISSLASDTLSKKDTKNIDDIHNYNCALLEDGLLFLNFLDAIAEGDGNRINRQYKFLLLTFRADGKHSTKYALECLYQLFLVNALLSPRDAERFTWNRSVNTFGGTGRNIPLDLDMEHSNRFVKQAIKNLGPNVTEKAIHRICHAESDMRKLTKRLDDSLQRVPDSGRHTSSDTERDLDILITRAMTTDIYTRKDSRFYGYFMGFERDHLKGLDMSSMYKWINGHKKNVILGIKAR